MNWRRIFTSPPPGAACCLDGGLAAVVHRDSKGGLHCAAETLPENTFDVGPVGLQAVQRPALATALAKLRGAAEGIGRVAVILPTGWMRSFLIDVDRVPRKRDELHDVVRWRLRKLLPVPPADLRLSVVPVQVAEGRRALLCMAALERAVATIESSFRNIGIEPGLISTRLFTVVPRDSGERGAMLVIQQEASFLSLLGLVSGQPFLLRTKPLPKHDDGASAVTREISLGIEYGRSEFAVDGDVNLLIVAKSDAVTQRIAEWVGDQPAGVRLVAASAKPLCAPTAIADRLGDTLLAPAVSVVTEGVR